jgi:hypothetical protein
MQPLLTADNPIGLLMAIAPQRCRSCRLISPITAAYSRTHLRPPALGHATRRPHPEMDADTPLKMQLLSWLPNARS